MVIRFPCKQCAKCCSQLAKEGWSGISLFPWEKHLFPAEDIIPSLGLGEHPDHPKFKTILYTYNTPSCIHLKEKTCTLYTQRPLICRSYPFRVTRQGDKTVYIVVPECTAVQDWPEKVTVDQHYAEMDAAELIGDHLSRFYKATEPRWRFKPGRGWVRIGRNKTID